MRRMLEHVWSDLTSRFWTDLKIIMITGKFPQNNGILVVLCAWNESRDAMLDVWLTEGCIYKNKVVPNGRRTYDPVLIEMGLGISSKQLDNLICYGENEIKIAKGHQNLNGEI